MKDKSLSAVTIIVGVVAMVALVFAVAVPSLLRARMSAGPGRAPFELYEGTPPATYPPPAVKADAYAAPEMNTDSTSRAR